jgi:uncharacterized glyoxalase superfamily protein PhnB
MFTMLYLVARMGCMLLVDVLFFLGNASEQISFYNHHFNITNREHTYLPLSNNRQSGTDIQQKTCDEAEENNLGSNSS